jgi:AcrR family transcriptional regulator
LTFLVRLNKMHLVPLATRRKHAAPRRRPPAAPAPERILSAALAAFAERGFDGATTREIAADAGVPQGLVSYHYASKQALWEAAADWMFSDLAAEFRAAAEALRDVDPATRLRATLKRFARFVARRPELHCFMTHEGSHDGPRLRWLVDRHLRPLFESSTALIREAAPGVDAAHLHYVLIGALAHVFAVAPEFARVTGRDARAPEMVEAHANVVVDLLVDGALARAAAAAPTKRARSAR